MYILLMLVMMIIAAVDIILFMAAFLTDWARR